MIKSCGACNKPISISNIPGGNPVADLIPGLWAKEYGTCSRCNVMFCGGCITSAGGKCPRCGVRTEVQGPPAGKRPELPENFQKLLKDLGEFRPLPPPPPKPEPSPEVRQRAAELAKARKLPPWTAEKHPEAVVEGIAAESDLWQACTLLTRVLGDTPPSAAGTDVMAAATVAVADVMAADNPGMVRSLVDAFATSAVKVAFVKASLEALAAHLAGPTPRPALDETRRALIGAVAALQVAPVCLLGGEKYQPEEAARRCTERTTRFRQAVRDVAEAQRVAPVPAAPPAGAGRPAAASIASEMTLKVRCPKCQTEYTVPESKFGKRARCGKDGCGHSFQLGITHAAG